MLIFCNNIYINCTEVQICIQSEKVHHDAQKALSYQYKFYNKTLIVQLTCRGCRDSTDSHLIPG